jgi:hypothetical protein
VAAERKRRWPLLSIRSDASRRLASAPGAASDLWQGIMIESRDFPFIGRNLSVRAASFAEGWRIRVFAGDQPATAVVYTITHENLADASAATAHLVHALMTLAQSNVEEGRVRLIA